MSVQTSRINRLDVGKPMERQSTSQLVDNQQWEAIQIRFHDFPNLPSKKGDSVKSSEFTCFGYRFCLSLYPGGTVDCKNGQFGIWLYSLTENKAGVMIRFGINIRNKQGEDVVERYHRDDSEIYIGKRATSLGKLDVGYRSNVLYSLVGGALDVTVRMKLIDEGRYTKPCIPGNPLCSNILKRFMDEESADVVFDVSDVNDEMKDVSGKRAKTTTTFHAHRFILQDGVPTLAELCKPSGVGAVVVPISNVKPEIFHHLLYYAYGGSVPAAELETNAKEIIDAADKYGAVNLKLEAEASYVNSVTFTTENILDNLLYADAKNCALLKEAVMDFVLQKKHVIMDKVSFDNVPGYIMKDLLAAVAQKEMEEDPEDNGITSNYNNMRVVTLRKMLHQKGLDVDGSREMMILRLKENS